MELQTERHPSAVARAGMSEDLQGVGSHRSVAHSTDVPLLNSMKPRGRRIATAYYEAGIVAGITIGREQAEEEMAQLWRQAHSIVQHAAKQPTYSDLCARRGEPHRAERADELSRERGVTR